jgi:hypothetical protein
MTPEPRRLSDDQYSEFKPQNITAQDLAELLPFLIPQWNISSKNGWVSKKVIEEIEAFKPHLRCYFS